MVKTVVKSVRLPVSLYDLTMSANKDKNFSQIVLDLLNRTYCFSTCKQEVATPCAQSPTESPLRSVNAEQEVDEFLSCLQRKKRDGEI